MLSLLKRQKLGKGEWDAQRLLGEVFCPSPLLVTLTKMLALPLLPNKQAGLK